VKVDDHWDYLVSEKADQHTNDVAVHSTGSETSLFVDGNQLSRHHCLFYISHTHTGELSTLLALSQGNLLVWGLPYYTTSAGIYSFMDPKNGP
jgi:hypothetical protein